MKTTILTSLIANLLLAFASIAVADQAPHADLFGAFAIKSLPASSSPSTTYMVGCGQILLKELPPGDYLFRLEESGDQQEFSILLPGGFKKAIFPHGSTDSHVDEYDFKVAQPTEMILLGERSVQASWRSIEVVGNTGDFKTRFVATEYPKAPLPTPLKPAPSRIAEIAAMLPDQAAAMGPNINDRAAWAAFAERNPGNHFIEHADADLKTPVPVLTDELFLTFKTKGTRRDYEIPFQDRRRRLLDMTIAECLTDTGKYLPGIERELDAILSEKTWMLPAHDTDLANFQGKVRNVDLEVAVRGQSVATTYSWLGDKLPEDLRKRIFDNLQSRVLQPYLSRIRDQDRTLCWWLTTSSNWNAVCSSGVLGTALAILPSKQDRAEIVAAVEDYLPLYLSGLGEDGYGEEGLGYWNYGFGHYVIIAETLLNNTGDKINLYNYEAVRRTATYPQRLQLQPGVYPTLGDCPETAKPFQWLRRISTLRISGVYPNLTPAETADDPIGGTIYEIAVAGFPLTKLDSPTSMSASDPGPALCDWFPTEGMVICRPANGTNHAFTVAFKGGRNFGSHRHLDLGEFLVALDGEMVLTDPGSEIYTAKKHETIEMVSSLGHSTPIVAGQVQRWSPDAEAKVLEKNFTPDSDELTLDLAAGYSVGTLRKLTRTYLYTRAGNGALTVTDDVTFDSPQSYGGLLITYGKVEVLGPDSARITVNGKSVHVEIKAEGPMQLTVEPIVTINKIAPTRLKVLLRDPIAQGKLVYQVQPE